MPAEFGGAHRAPGDAVAGAVQAAERAGEPRHVRQQVRLRHEDVFQNDLSGDRGAQAELAFDLRSGETLHAAFQHEAANDAVIGLGPYHEDVGDGRIGDPHLVAGHAEAARDRLGPGDHRSGIGAVIRLGQTEAAYPLAGRELGQIFHPLLFGAVGIDRMHHKRALHAHCRAVAGVDALGLARHEAVDHVACGRAAVLFRQSRPEQAEFAKLPDDVAIEFLLAIRHQNSRHQLFLTIRARRIADHAFVVRELAFQQQRIVPLKDAVFVGRNGLDVLGQSHRIHVGLLKSWRRIQAPASWAISPCFRAAAARSSSPSSASTSEYTCQFRFLVLRLSTRSERRLRATCRLLLCAAASHMI